MPLGTAGGARALEKSAAKDAFLNRPASGEGRLAPPGRPAAARAVGSYLPKLMRKAFEKYGFSTAALITDWAQIVGQDLALSTRPERLRWPRETDGNVEANGALRRRGATLLISVDPAVALEVQYRARQILERINAYFGYHAVAELRLVQGSLRPPHAPPSRLSPQQPVAPAPQLASIGDEALRSALARMHAGVVGRAVGA